MAKVLVVDDNAENRDLVVTLLNYQGHRAYQAADGHEGLTLAKAEKPHLVICDILMPTMDGYEFVHHLRSDPVIRNTEVIFFTASYHGSEAQSLAKALGVSRIVTKPCEPRELMQIISLSLGESASGAASAKVDGLADGLEFFARDHLKLVTNKLAENTDQLQRVNH
ncbi:MAG: response regulator [Candidatus Protistobacter heckmanni]|nr:response regulator [Candidatus Protistobacter heckmanni]